MPLLKSKPDNTPGGLASELAAAKAKREAEAARVEAEFEARRSDVLARTYQRQIELDDLIAEAQKEQEALGAVVSQA